MKILKRTAEPTIFVESAPNPDVRLYHTSVEISHAAIHLFDKGSFDADYMKDDKEELGPMGANLVHELFLIDGVKSVFIKPFELTLTKGSAYKWKDVHDDVIADIKHCFDKEPKVITVRPCDVHGMEPKARDVWELSKKIAFRFYNELYEKVVATVK